MQLIYFTFLLLLFTSCGVKDNDFPSDLYGIDKICLSSKGDNVCLLKINEEWLVDGIHKTNRLNTNNLFEILRYLDYEYPLSKSRTESVLYSDKNIKTNGLKISQYKKGSLIKGLYLLFSEDKIYGLIEGSNKAYAVYLPGSTVNLNEYLVAESNFWLDNTLFKSKVKDIKQVSVRDNFNLENSFTLKNDTTFHLIDIEGNCVKSALDSTLIKRYITYYNSLYFKQYITDAYRNYFIDSCIYDIFIATEDSNVHYSVFYKKDDETIYDRDEFFLVNNNSNDTLIANWINFDILLKSLSDFKKQ